MTDKRFYDLWQDALAQPDEELYIAEYGYPDWFDEISTDAMEVIDKLRQIHWVAQMPVREILSETGMTQAAFACKFCIPRRTLQDWVRGIRQCPDYLRLLFAMQLGMITK